MKIGIGVTTYNRPEYLRQCLDGIRKIESAVDVVYIYNDGSSEDYSSVEVEPFKYYEAKKNRGVAFAKNWLLRKMLADGCDYMFLCEDDIVPLSAKAITEYIRLSEKSGIEHFMFAHHGPVGKEKFAGTVNGVDLFSGCVGAWCMYTRRVIETVGFFDEDMMNAWEHVEHTMRIAKAGLTTPWGVFPDVHGSKKWLKDIPGSIDNSSIKVRPDWMANTINGLIYWKQKSPRDFPLQHILDGLLAEEDEEYKRLGITNQRFK